MTDHDRFARLSDVQLHEIHAACESFEQALLADGRARIEEWLARVAVEVQDILFRELLAIELETHSPIDSSRVADFLARFPDRTGDIQQVLQEVSETCVLRKSERIHELKRPGVQDRDSSNRYRLDGEIARGGMGVIFKGLDTSLDRDLAIKVLHESLKDRPEVVHRFVEEAQIGAQLQHPGIAPIYELGQFADERPFFAMKLIKGETLAKLLADRKMATDERGKLIGIFEQVCQTMAYAHSRGVIHRDLKPANIMVGAFGEVQVMDWGLAKVLSTKQLDDERNASTWTNVANPVPARRDEAGDTSSTVGSRGLETRVGSVMGTPAYMSPEQARGESDQMDERADVFGLGAILCEILTGQPPFVSTSANELIRQASSGDLSDCMARLKSCEADEDLITLTSHCLKPQADDRPRDAGVLAKRVAGYLESVETKLRTTELELVTQAARADAEAAQREAEQRRVILEQQSAQNLRRMLAGIAVVAVIALGTSLVATKYWRDARNASRAANEQQRIAEANLVKAETSEREATEQRNRAAQVAEESQQKLYCSQMHLAQKVWWEHRGMSNMDSLLAQWLPAEDALDRRGWEWYYLTSLPFQGVRTFTDDHGYKGPITVAWNVSRNLIAEGTTDSLIRIWDVETQKPIRVFQGDLPPTKSWSGGMDRWLAWNPDGSQLAAGFGDKTVRIWDTQSGQQLKVLRGLDSDVLSVAFSSSGTHIAACGINGSFKVWDISTGDLTGGNVHPEGVTAAAWSLDDEWFACGHSNGTVTVSGTRPDDRVARSRVSSSIITSLAWSPDGSQLAVASRADHTARILDIASKKVVGSPLRHSHVVTSVEWEPGGKRLATASFDQTIKIWNTTTWRDDLTLRGHHYPVTSLAWGINGQLASVSNHDILKVWDATHEQESSVLAGDQPLWSVAWSPDGKQLAAGENNGRIRIWNLATRKTEIEFGAIDTGQPDERLAPNHSMSWSPDGRFIASSGNGGWAKVFRVADGQAIYSLPHDQGPVIAVAWNRDGTRLAAGCQDGTIQVVEDIPQNPTIASFHAHEGGVGAVAWSPQGDYLASGGSNDNLLKVWDSSNGVELNRMQGHKTYVGVDRFGIAWSPDGKRLVSCAGSAELILWNATSGQNTATLNGHSDAVHSAAWCSDGKRIASAGADDTVRIWDPLTDQETFMLRGHLGRFSEVSWHPDGTKLAAACDDGQVWIWDATIGFEQDRVVQIQGKKFRPSRRQKRVR